jgi:hypothetical protein
VFTYLLRKAVHCRFLIMQSLGISRLTAIGANGRLDNIFHFLGRGAFLNPEARGRGCAARGIIEETMSLPIGPDETKGNQEFNRAKKCASYRPKTSISNPWIERCARVASARVTRP